MAQGDDNLLDYSGLTEYDAAIKDYIDDGLSEKQDTLVSGTNIKTINSQSLLGSGNITISGGSGNYLPLTGGTLTGPLTIDDANDYGQVNFADENASLYFANGTGISTSAEYDDGSTVWPRIIAMNAFYVSSDTQPAYAEISAWDASYQEAAHVRATTDGVVDVKGTTVSLSDAAPWRSALSCWGADKGGTSYWGLVNPEGSSSGWVRTPTSGLLPAAQGGGSSSLGTSYWPFANLYAENIYHNGHKIGDTAYGAGQTSLASVKAAVSVAASTTVNMDTISIPPGTWLVTYGVEFASNATGYRRMTLTTNATSVTSTPLYMESVAPANGFATNISKTQVVVNSGTSNVTRYLNVYHTGSAALNCRSCIQAVRIA